DSLVSPWERLDSLQVLEIATGKKITGMALKEVLKKGKHKVMASRRENRERFEKLAPLSIYTATNFVLLEGRIGEQMSHEIAVSNAATQTRTLNRKDASTLLKTDTDSLNLPPTSERKVSVVTQLSAGARTLPLVFTQGDSIRLEVRFSLVGHDLNEADFVASKDPAKLPVWLVPEGRETLYLRLASTEKLMTVYREGKVYSKVAVGRQLDELSLVGLAQGTYLLEVIDLRSGEKRYHGLRR
ncbi:MAG: hypothetical protein AAF597_10845, partial [Bacteroidota bacterium]